MTNLAELPLARQAWKAIDADLTAMHDAGGVPQRTFEAERSRVVGGVLRAVWYYLPARSARLRLPS